MRCFIAVPAPTSPELLSVLGALGKLGRAVRAVKNDALHVTLRFLGGIDSTVVPEVVDALRCSTQGVEPFDLSVAGLGVFPKPRRPAVVWAGVHDGGQLDALVTRLSFELELIGFVPDERPFNAHITLARIKARPPAALHEILDEHANTSFDGCTVDAVKLMQSELTPQGPIYSVVEAVRLDTSGA